MRTLVARLLMKLVWLRKQKMRFTRNRCYRLGPKLWAGTKCRTKNLSTVSRMMTKSWLKQHKNNQSLCTTMYWNRKIKTLAKSCRQASPSQRLVFLQSTPSKFSKECEPSTWSNSPFRNQWGLLCAFGALRPKRSCRTWHLKLDKKTWSFRKSKLCSLSS